MSETDTDAKRCMKIWKYIAEDVSSKYFDSNVEQITRLTDYDCEENPVKVVDLFLEMLRRFNSQSNGGKP